MGSQCSMVGRTLGEGRLGRRVTGDSRVTHDALFAQVPLTSAVQDTPVVPYDEITWLPAMPVHARRTTRGGEERIEQRIGLVGSEARYGVRMAADEQCRTAGDRMHLHERPQLWRLV